MPKLQFYIDFVKASTCPRLKQLFDFKTLDVNIECNNSSDNLCADCMFIDNLPYKTHTKIVNHFFYKSLCH